MRACVMALVILGTGWAGAGEIDGVLVERLQNTPPMEKVQVIVYLKDQVDLAAVEELMQSSVGAFERIPVDVRYRTVLTALQTVAEQTQPGFLGRLQALEAEGLVSEIQPFWIRNLIVMQATPSTIEEISRWPDAGTVYLDGLLELDAPVYSAEGSSNPEASEAGLRAINAHLLWARGITGAGRLVMNIDTGVFGNNASFNTRWRGTLPGILSSWAWFDPETNTTFPTDGDATSNHGTHTVGTMCGVYSSTSDTIGVAPGAMWIAAKTLNSSPHTSRSIAAFQWAANPDSNINTMDDVPDAISNSWRDPAVSTAQECSPTSGGYGPVIQAIEALGTAVIFSAGNSGPGASTITSPKNRNVTRADIFSVGAVDGNSPTFPIASFSSRGPSLCAGPDSLRVKPEVSAPGVNVRSASGTSGFRVLSGTSMASPHVAGAIALLRQAAPNVTGTELKYLLMSTATDLGSAGEDNDYGHGIIDVWRAYQALADPVDPNPPTNVTAYSDFSTPTSMLLKWSNPTALAGGDSIGPFVTRIKRDGVQVVELPDSDSSYVDTALVDGTLYRYTLQARLLANDSLSRSADAEWIAGGARTPRWPVNLTVSGTSASGYVVRWTNPSRQIDGTPLDDLTGIRLYRNGGLITTLARTSADTGRVDSTMDVPPAGLHSYVVTAIDNENPINESAASNTGFTPLELPFTDDFPSPGAPNTAIWRTVNVTVDDRGVSPPSPPYAMNLNGTPVANGDTCTTLGLDLSGLQGAGVAISYFRQPRGSGDTPEVADSLIVEFRNSLGQWIAIRKYPGLAAADPTPPFTFDAVGVDGVDPGSGATFFYNGFQLRFRTKATAGAFDDWFVDDVFFGIPTGAANIGVSSVLAPTGQISNGAPVNPVVRVQNFSAVQSGPFSVTMHITGPGTPYSASQLDSNVAAGSAKNTTIGQAFVPDAAGMWSYTAYTTLAGDPSTANDTLRGTFFAVNPLSLPVIDSFADSGVVNPLMWTNRNATVNRDAVNPPSPPFALNLAGNPTGQGLDTVTSLIINLAGTEGTGVSLSYYQQPQGVGDVPEAADSLVTEGLNSLGQWVAIKKLPGAAVRPFQLERFNLDSISAGGGSWFHSGFKFRFRSRATSVTAARQDDWFVDEVFLGSPSGNPSMVVTPLAVSDTVLVNSIDTTSYSFAISNTNPFAAALGFSISESPAVTWLAVSPEAGSIPGSGTQQIRIRVNFSGVTAGTYATNLVVSGNDSTNVTDTVAVSFLVNSQPVMSVSPDSFHYTLSGPQVRSDSFSISNSGAGPLNYTVRLEPAIAGVERMEITSAGGSSFTGSPRVRGNGFQVNQNTTLIKIQFGLTVTQDNTDIDYFVYESDTQTGTFTKIFSNVKTQNTTGGFQLVSSDPVRVVLTAGKFYYIGAAWQGATSTEYRYSTTTTPPTWGTVLGRFIGPNTAFPAPSTLNITAFTAAGPYFAALETGLPFDLTLTSPSAGVIAPGGNTSVVFRMNTASIPVGNYLSYIDVLGNDPLNSSDRVAVNVDFVTSVGPSAEGIPLEFELHQNYPNPFNPGTRISFGIPEESRVTVKVYNIIGQEIAVLVNEKKPAGYHAIEWDGRNSVARSVTSGVYFYRMEASSVSGRSFTQINKMLLLK